MLVLVFSSSRALGVLYWIILTGIACLRFWKEKKHIGFKLLFCLITRNISLLWEGRTVSFHLQGLAFTKSCCLNFSSSGSSCGGSTSTCRTDTCNTGYNDYWDQTWKYIEYIETYSNFSSSTTTKEEESRRYCVT